MAEPALAMEGDAENMAPPVSDEQRRADLEAALSGIVSTLQGLADAQVLKKDIIEQRWLEDLRQFHGRYDELTEKALAASPNKSRLFVNMTRTKTHSWEARLGDLLFPTDDKNWAITSTPVPKLGRDMAKVQGKIDETLHQVNAHIATGNVAAAAPLVQQGEDLVAKRAELEATLTEAKERAELMETEIHDQFVESKYDIRARDAIRDMMRLGTAIMKGPVTAQQMRRRWEQVANDATGDYGLQVSPDPKPEYVRVDPWAFFPDMSSPDPDSFEFTFERHLWNRKDLRAASKRLGFIEEATKELLRQDPRGVLPPYYAQLQTITSNTNQFGLEKRFQVWEYHGSIQDNELELIAEATGNPDLIDHVMGNPMAELRVIMFFCQGILLKIAPHTLDSGDSLYSLVPFEPDDTSPFGFGVPYLMRDSQKAINSAWRMTMDNAALSVGPQVVIDRRAITPSDGEMSLKPRKIWYMNTSSITKMPEGYKPFMQFKIESGQLELERIVNMARQFADDETNMPPIAYGEQGSHLTKTAQGLSMLMNSANVVFRRVVKQWDDGMTVPNLRRAYDWNMQFSKRTEIKGDFNVEARGSSVLLVRELQSQTLLNMLTQFSANPVLGPLMKVAPAFRKFVQTQMITASDIVKSDEEIREDQQAAANAAKQGANLDPNKQAELQSKERIAQAENERAVAVEGMRRETALITLAQTHNMKLDELNAKIGIEKVKLLHNERLAAVDVAEAHKDRKAGENAEDKVKVGNL